jgi:hypothetical protein
MLSFCSAQAFLGNIMTNQHVLMWCAVCCGVQVIRDKKTKKSKGFGIVSLMDGGDYAKVSRPSAAALCHDP